VTAAPSARGLAAPPEPELDDRVSGSTLYHLAACERRVWLLRHAPGEQAPPGEFDLALMERGRLHEEAVRRRFTGLVGPLWRWGQPLEPAAAETLRLLRESRAPLDQPLLLSADGRRVGVPDFLYWEDGALVVHDAKLAESVDRKPEIALQLTHYARLLEEAGFRVARLEITSGLGEVLDVPRLDDASYDAAIARALELHGAAPEPDLLLAHSTCAECGFYDRCWDRAESEGRIEVLSGVRRNHLPILHGMGIRTIADLAAREPHELEVRGLGRLGPPMVLEARAHRDRRAVWIARPELPAGRPRVWLDLEGDPQDERFGHVIYLWGLGVEETPGAFAAEAILAGPGADGDELGWRRFVERASAVLDEFPESVWVHYANYEKTWVRKYAERWGAPEGFLERLTPRLFDLYSALIKWVRLPLRSYSIKHIAPWIGYAWSNPESGSAWSIVQFRRACAADDPEVRRGILDEIARYNADDLGAMRAVWDWVEANGPKG